MLFASARSVRNQFPAELSARNRMGTLGMSEVELCEHQMRELWLLISGRIPRLQCD